MRHLVNIKATPHRWRDLTIMEEIPAPQLLQQACGLGSISSGFLAELHGCSVAAHGFFFELIAGKRGGAGEDGMGVEAPSC